MEPTKPDIVFENPKKGLAVRYYKEHFGNIWKVCKQIGINRCTFYEWLNKDPIFKQTLAEISYADDIVDAAKHEVMRRIKGYYYKEVHETIGNEGVIVKTVKKRVSATDSLLLAIINPQNSDGNQDRVINIVIETNPNADV